MCNPERCRPRVEPSATAGVHLHQALIVFPPVRDSPRRPDGSARSNGPGADGSPRKISYEKDLFDVFKEDIVPSGVAPELSHLQQQGYTYIKP